MSKDFNYTDVQNQSLINPQGSGSSVPEIYIPLWWYSGSLVATQATSITNTCLLAKGSTSYAPSSYVQTHLHTLNSSWSRFNKYAFEVTIYNSSYVSQADLWDITSDAIVLTSQVVNDNTVARVVRSGIFTLTPGHVYGVAMCSGGGVTYITDASLIVFPS